MVKYRIEIKKSAVKELIAINEAANNISTYIQNQINIVSAKANQDLIDEMKSFSSYGASVFL